MTVSGIATSDFAALADLKTRAIKDAKGTAPEVARQFEGIFLQSMLKSMRMGEHFLDENSPFRGKDRETFQDMLDAQYASTIASSKGIGLAEMLTKQLESVASASQKTTVDEMQSPINFSALPTVMPKQPVEKDTDHELNSVDDFVKSIWPRAKAAAAIIGLDPKILMAQAALETGWGKFIAKDSEGISTNNLFNIKSGSQNSYESVDVKTTEYIADTPIKMNASFRKYPSIEASFDDYISLVKTHYQDALANVGNPETYVSELHKAGYATDPEYKSKILSIYHGDELSQAMLRCGLSEQI